MNKTLVLGGAILVGALVLANRKGAAAAAGGGSALPIFPFQSYRTPTPPSPLTSIPGRGSSGAVLGGGSVNPNAPATSMPVLPPGTRSDVIEAVREAFENGDLTNRQASAVSQLYAPLYNPPEEGIIDLTGGRVESSYTGEVPAGVGGTTQETVVDFGSVEAAEAALTAYMANFR